MSYSKQTINSFTGLLSASLNRQDNNFSLKPPFDVELAVNILGGKIIEKEDNEFEKKEEDSFYLIYNKFEGEVRPTDCEEKKFEIILPKDGDEKRKRFTIAHEIGHIMLHFYWPDKKKWKKKCEQIERGETKGSMFRGERNRVEYEANHFAACFLMPEELVTHSFNSEKKESKNIEEIIKALSIGYNVSYNAMETRLKFLKILHWDE